MKAARVQYSHLVKTTELMLQFAIARYRGGDIRKIDPFRWYYETSERTTICGLCDHVLRTFNENVPIDEMEQRAHSHRTQAHAACIQRLLEQNLTPLPFSLHSAFRQLDLSEDTMAILNIEIVYDVPVGPRWFIEILGHKVLGHNLSREMLSAAIVRAASDAEWHDALVAVSELQQGSVIDLVVQQVK